MVARLFAWLLIVAGLFLALFGLLFDYILPSSSPGISLPQMLIIAAGIGLAALGLFLRRDKVRQRLLHDLRATLGKGALVIILTIIALEVVLSQTGSTTYFHTALGQNAAALAPFSGKVFYWFDCNEGGCRFAPTMVNEVCTQGLEAGRRCAINRSGFRDDDEFVTPSADIAQRVLLLGDSFTHGFAADLHRAFPELLDAALPETLIWNTGHTGNGTNGAIASFQAYAPVLSPQLTILGFFVGNDFVDNLYPPDSWVRVAMEDGEIRNVRHYNLDRLGNPVNLDLETTLHYHARYSPAPSNLLEKALGTTRLGALLLRTLDRIGEIAFGKDYELQNRRITRAYLTHLADITAAHDSRLLVLIIPSKKDLVQQSHEYTDAVELLRELAIPYIEVIDLLDADADYKARDPHWNNSGHRIVSEILAECIEDFFAAGSLSACDKAVMP